MKYGYAMLTNALFRNASALIIIFILMALTVTYTTQDDAPWQEISSKGLHGKMQTGITQIYWQWQAQGRAGSIEYWPQNAQQPFAIEMTPEGLPVVAKSERGCLQFLFWFVDEKLLNKSLNVTTTYIHRNISDIGQNLNDSQTLGNDQYMHNTDLKREFDIFVCQYQYAGNVHRYNINTGLLTLTN
jgi:hypothetical protein